jgi:hypothetical protein
MCDSARSTTPVTPSPAPKLWNLSLCEEAAWWGYQAAVRIDRLRR